MTTNDDCNCAMKDLMPLVGDDVNLIGTLFPGQDNEWVTHSVVIPVKVSIRPDGSGLEALIRQYNSLKDVPASMATRQEILEHIRDALHELRNYDQMASDAITRALQDLQSDMNIWEVSIED